MNRLVCSKCLRLAPAWKEEGATCGAYVGGGWRFCDGKWRLGQPEDGWQRYRDAIERRGAP